MDLDGPVCKKQDQIVVSVEVCIVDLILISLRVKCCTDTPRVAVPTMANSPLGLPLMNCS